MYANIFLVETFIPELDRGGGDQVISVHSFTQMIRFQIPLMSTSFSVTFC